MPNLIEQLQTVATNAVDDLHKKVITAAAEYIVSIESAHADLKTAVDELAAAKAADKQAADANLATVVEVRNTESAGLRQLLADMTAAKEKVEAEGLQLVAHIADLERQVTALQLQIENTANVDRMQIGELESKIAGLEAKLTPQAG